MLSAYLALVLLAQSPQLMAPPKQMPPPIMSQQSPQEYNGGYNNYQAAPCSGSEQVRMVKKIKYKKMKRRSC